MKKTLRLSLILLVVISCAKAQKLQESKLFTDFKTDKSNAVLPDFSYVGYRSGEKEIPKVKHKIFNVTDFGAKADDNESDRKAIELAIAAAKKNGSGIVFFPAGRFLLNEDNYPKTSIVIDGSNIVFRGSGAGKGGTELFMKNSFSPTNPAQMWTTPKMFIIGNSQKNEGAGKVSEKAAIGEFTLRLNSSSALKPGDWILLSMNSADSTLLQYDLQNLPSSKEWSIMQTGVKLRMYHQIKRVGINEIVLEQPIAYPIDPKHNWAVYKIVAPTQELGLEDIAFVGNWHEQFEHHKSWLHDSGWSMMEFRNTFNSWIKNCRFTDINAAAVIGSCANISVMDCEITGNPGHEAIANTGGTNILLANILDKASMWHSVGVANPSINTVVFNCSYPGTTCFEAHSSQPRNTLLDNVKGGLLNSRGGGAMQNMPNHLRNLVIWNYQQTNAVQKDFEFWPIFPWYWRIPYPVIAGFSGGTTFNKSQLHQQSELTDKVFPNSLYEAQLKLRLGKVPKWLRQ